MTDGSISGTGGETRFRLGPWGVIALVSIPVCLVNATSVLIELQRLDLPVHPAEPFLWEFSSALILVLMAPLVGGAVRRWPLEGPGIWTALVMHLGLTIPFSLVHVAGIYGVRQAVYALLGRTYDFFGDGVWLTFLYEWRKDVISYAIFVAVFTAAIWLERRRDAASAAPPPERIEVRDGGRTLFIAPADILYLEAAGNYVEIHTAQTKHLIRGTLAAWEKTLAGLGFVRIHRSRLVNKAHIGALQPTGSGDFEVALGGSGRTLQGSRRYRANLG
ncbi:MAG: LytTR family DNA-binding domain-containing protein [Hyphomonas sp.]|nr:LytTR family DNA-binding domain-containing protein [Hyphomonas sp.]